MPQCPICDTDYKQEQGFCSVCGYEVRPYESPYLSYLDGFNARENRTKELLRTWWMERKSQQDKIQALIDEIDNPKSHPLVHHVEEPIYESKSLDATCRVSTIPHYFVRSEINKRENNEDSFQILQVSPGFEHEPITVLAIADGMGGHTHGEDASREVLRKVGIALHEQLSVELSLNSLDVKPHVDVSTLSKALMGALEQANTYLRRLVQANKWGNAGSTIVICAILSDDAVVGYLGDSPLFHFDHDLRKLTKITEDHTVAGVLQRAGLITEEMARFHEGRSRLEFYVGCPQLPKDEPIHHVVLKPQDILLLCSDGISGALSEAEITEVLVKNGENLAQAADVLIETSRLAGETDNQTLILWRHSGSKQQVFNHKTVVQSVASASFLK